MRPESPNETLCPAAGGMGETTPVPSASAHVLRQPTTPSRKRGVGSDRRPLCESRGPERLGGFPPAGRGPPLGPEGARLRGGVETLGAQPPPPQKNPAPHPL